MLSKIYIVVLLTSVAVSQCAHFSDGTQSDLYDSDMYRKARSFYSPYSSQNQYQDLDLTQFMVTPSGNPQYSEEDVNQYDNSGFSSQPGYAKRRSSASRNLFDNGPDASEEKVYGGYGKSTRYRQSAAYNQQSSGEQGYNTGSQHNNYKYQQQPYNANNQYQQHDQNQQSFEREIYEQVNPMPQSWYQNQQQQQQSSEEYNSQEQTYGSSRQHKKSNQYSQKYGVGFSQGYNSRQQQSSQELLHNQQNSYEGAHQNQQYKSYTPDHYNSQYMQQQQYEGDFADIKKAPRKYVQHSSDELGGRYVQNKQGSRQDSSSEEDSSNESSFDRLNVIDGK